MAVGNSSIAGLRRMYLNNDADPLEALDAALARANHNASQNVYLSQDVEWSHGEARKLCRDDIATQPLWGVPVSLKDCFELEGFPTTCGSRFYLDHHGIAAKDSAVARKLRAAGAILTGKTHLHQLAYGITGENRDFGDCVQPLNPACLTGGSSSGAAASVQEGSAMAAIGTDTGGSVRAPAALCGVAGYRSSITLNPASLWGGGYHLAATFDTVGWLYGDLADGPLLGHALLELPVATAPAVAGLRVGCPDPGFTQDCEQTVLETLRDWRDCFEGLDASVDVFDAGAWAQSTAIYAPLQASEAAALHRGYYEHFEPVIA
ncbi:MAG: amidase, partial [Acidobacteriaceae bacterium]